MRSSADSVAVALALVLAMNCLSARHCRSRRLVAIVNALREDGPPGTAAINSRLPDPYIGSRSINLATRTP
jgi:hypothetical protein